ncbi:MAG: lysylphosphatidylglycerol synthase transmembrane domain-containing protein [Ktedonobacteraceae bacterium]
MSTHDPGNTPFDEIALTSTEEKGTSVHVVPAVTASEPSITREQISISKRLLNWRTLVPLAIVLVFLAYTAQKLQINPAQTWATMHNANVIFLLAAFFTYYLSFPIRTLRWRMLLENVGYRNENGVHLPRFRKLLEILYISWFANAIVPAKLGDVYRAYLLRQEAEVSATRTFGTVLAERLLDLIVLLLLFLSAIIVSLHANLPVYLRAGLYVTLAIVLVGIGTLLLLRTFPGQIRSFIPQRFQGHYEHLQEGTLGSFRRIPTLTLLTVLVWLCEAGRFFFVSLALNLIPGDLPHMAAAAIFIALGEALLTIVPFTSGGIGLVEVGMIAMLTLFTPSHNLAAAGVLLDRTISLFSILGFGLLVFLVAAGKRAARKRQNLDV